MKDTSMEKEFCVVKVVARIDFEIPKGMSRKQRKEYFRSCRETAVARIKLFPEGGSIELGRTRTRRFKS